MCFATDFTVEGEEAGDQPAVRDPGVSVNQSTFALLPAWSEGDGRNCQCLDFHLISLVSMWPGPAPHCARCPQGKSFSGSASSDKPRVFYQNETEVASWHCRPSRRPERLSALYIQIVNQPPTSAPPLTRPCTGNGSFLPLNLPTALWSVGWLACLTSSLQALIFQLSPPAQGSRHMFTYFQSFIDASCLLLFSMMVLYVLVGLSNFYPLLLI